MKKFSRYTKIILMIFDVFVVLISYFFTAFLISDMFFIYSTTLKIKYFNTILIGVFIYIIFLNLMHVYKNITKYENGWDYVRYIAVCAMSFFSISLIGCLFNLNIFSVKMNLLSSAIVARFIHIV